MTLARLIGSEWRRNGLMLLPSLLAVAAATGLLVWTLGTYTTASAQHDAYLKNMLGSFDGCIVPDKPDRPFQKGVGFQQSAAEKARVWGVPERVLEAARTLPAIEQVEPFSVTQVQIAYRPDGKPLRGPRPRGFATVTAMPACPYGNDQLDGQWLQQHATDDECVISTALFFRRPPPAIGSMVELMGENGPVPVQVAGLINQQRIDRSLPAIFVTPGVYSRLGGERTGPKYDIALCRLKAGTDWASVEQSLQAALADSEYPCRIADGETLIAGLAQQALRQLLRQGPLLIALALLATICIIVTTLNIDISRNVRTLALLRAAGMQRGGVFLMTALKGSAITLVGCLLGIVFGWIALYLMVQRMPELFPNGVALGLPTISAAIGCALIGCLSTLVPARRAARFKPLDVLKPNQHGISSLSVVRILIGCLFFLPAPVLALPLPMDAALRCRLLLLAGLPSMMIGFVLIAPLCIRLTEIIMAGPLGVLLGIPPSLLRRQLSRNVGQTTGALITLCIGLGLYVAIQTWGYSMLQPFVPNPGFPDAIIGFLPNGIPMERLEDIRKIPAVDSDSFIPLEAEQFILSDSTLGQIKTNLTGELNQNNILVMGVDPEKTFTGADPLCPFKFTKGNAPEAANRLAQGNACIVPRMFTDQTGLGMGDTISIRVSRSDTSEENVALEIVGVVDINWHLITARSRLRGQDGNTFYTMAPAFISFEQARAISSHGQPIRFCWLNLTPDHQVRPPQDVTRELQQSLRKLRLGRDLEIKVSLRDDVTSGTIRHANDILRAMARIPLWSLGILILGVVNTIVASLCTRRYEFGVLRAMGATRFLLVRLVMAEGLMIGLAAILFSLLFGIGTGWSSTGLTRGRMAFGGLPVTFQIPWTPVLTGLGITLALCLLAALIPAWRTGQTDTTRLLTQED
jgi:putative ABC transport system permease protein